MAEKKKITEKNIFSQHKPLKVTILTDIHFYSKRNGASGAAYLIDNDHNQKLIGESEEVVKQAFRLIVEDKDSDIVLIHGDITNNGEIYSHEDIVPLLKELRNSGKKIFVTYSTHDYRRVEEGVVPTARGYDGDNIISVPVANLEQVREYYKEFGHDQAIAVHEPTFSYVAQIADGYRIMALNDDTGYRRSGYKDDQMDWIKEQYDKAIAENQYIIAMAHHPVLAPSPLYDIIGGLQDIIDNNIATANKLADIGINCIFTGHTHIHDISYMFSDNKNVFYDVSTGSLVGYPPTMRKVEFNPKDNLIDVKTHIIQEVEGIDMGELKLPMYIRKNFFGMIEEIVESGSKGDIPRFSELANGMSIKPYMIKKVRYLIKPLCKFLMKLSIGRVGNWTRAETGLKKADYKDIKNEKVVPFIMEIVTKLYAGDPNNHPDGNHYKIAMGLMAIIDSLLGCLPINLKKITGYGSVSEIVEPLVYNKGICDDNALLNTDSATAIEQLPAITEYVAPFKSKKGWKILAVLALIALLLSPILIPVAIIFFIVRFIKKLFKKKNKTVKA